LYWLFPRSGVRPSFAGARIFSKDARGRAYAPVFFVRRRVRRRQLAPAQKRGGWSAARRNLDWRLATPAPFAIRAHASWRSIAACIGRLSPPTQAPGLGFLGRAAWWGLPASPCPSPASSSQSGRNAARPGPGASRVPACEAGPRASHTDPVARYRPKQKPALFSAPAPIWLLHFANASRSAPHEQVIGI